MAKRKIRVTISGTGFAGDFTAQAFSMIPHINGVDIELSGVCSGHLGNAQRFAKKHHVVQAYETHEAMLESVHPDIDCIACANHAHAEYVVEAAEAGVGVIVLEKPPLIWPGYALGRTANAATRKTESMNVLAGVFDTVQARGIKLLYAENHTYVDGIKAFVELLREAIPQGKGSILLQQGICAHQGSHAPAYDTPEKSGGGSLFNKACHPLGPALYLKQVEGILKNNRPIRPVAVSAMARQVLKDLAIHASDHFRPMENVDDYGRLTVVFEDGTLAELTGHDLNISGIRNGYSCITDFAEYTVRINPNDEHELFLPDGASAGNLLLREKLPTAQGTSFPRPRQFHAHGYVNEIEDAVRCALDPARHPQSGPMLAWDTMAILMAGYESAENGSQLTDITEYTLERAFPPEVLPDPASFGAVLQRK